MLPTCERVLRHQDADNDDICWTGALAPADTVDAGAVNERLKDEVSGLVSWRGGKDSDDERDGANRVPPH